MKRLFRLVRRPATLGLVAAFLIGIAAGGLGTYKAANDLGVITGPEVDQVYPALEDAAVRFEADLADGIAYRTLQRPFFEGKPAPDAGYGAYTEGALSLTGGYQQINLIDDVANASVEEASDLAGWSRTVLFLANGKELIRRAPVPEEGGDPIVWQTVTLPTGMGIDVRTARSIPTLLRTLAVESEEPLENGGARYAGSAPATSYPGAVASDLVFQTSAGIVVFVELDADGRLVFLAIRAANLLLPAIEYVTEVIFAPAGETPAWVEESRP